MMLTSTQISKIKRYCANFNQKKSVNLYQNQTKCIFRQETLVKIKAHDKATKLVGRNHNPEYSCTSETYLKIYKAKIDKIKR